MTDAPAEPEKPAAKPVRVLNFVDPTKVKGDLTYSIANLSGAMVDQAALFAHYGELAAKAARQVDDLELMLDVAKAKVSRVVRDEAAKAGLKPSVAQVEADVMVHGKVIEYRQAINAAKQIEASAKTLVEAFKQRKDMLIQLGAGEREEKKGELRINAKRIVEEDMQERQSRLLRHMNERESA